MRIVIVGGVSGGMSCAARARRIDESAEIIVLERGPYVSFANCGLPYYVSGEITDRADLLVQTPERLAASLNLDVRPHHDVTGVDPDNRTMTVATPEGTQTLSYDALVLAPGAQAFRPPIDGIDESTRVRTLRTVDDAITLRDRVDAGAQKAVVLGAGFIGIEAAEALALQGLDTTVIELADHVLPPLDDEPAWFITNELARLGITVRTGVSAERITPGAQADTVHLSDGTTAEADIIVLSVGVRPDTAVFEAAGIPTENGAITVDEHGRTGKPHIWAVGDATASIDAVTGIRRPVALAGPANRAGGRVADSILRPDTARPIPRPLGTAIVRVGTLTAAMTGAGRESLRKASIPFTTAHLHPPQHAGYFPGASPMHITVHFAPDTGQLLGAQIVGPDGVDKRIDLFATALRAQWSITELSDLDLAYSPPYGAAKDPINLAGMVGANMLDGTLATWNARELDHVRATAVILDVRTDEEIATGMITGALHIPHTELRSRLDEVRAAAHGRPVRVMCASGVRSAIAHRVLVQAGFDSASLSGGMITLRALLGNRIDSVLTSRKESDREPF
ncbi:FAD-dependent oxidoreductase [Microbacterium sp. YY-01]|uniref:FAD-dependent oxidoreductase n=1 Tax=Microbacterium sp. YY-01 TaxID=3421634 RepID=UPI003D18218F